MHCWVGYEQEYLKYFFIWKYPVGGRGMRMFGAAHTLT